MTRTLIIGHRGAPSLARENTLESFHKAIEIGVDLIEFDVRRTRDGALIVYHDELLLGRRVRDLAYEELSQMTSRQGLSVLRLEEVLTSIGGKVRLDVEIKEEGYEREVLVSLLKYLRKDHFVVTSFHGSSLRKTKEIDPDIRVGLILGVSAPTPLRFMGLLEIFSHQKRVKEAKADFMVPHWRLLRFGFLNRAKRMSRMVWVWTVNEEKMIRRMLQDPRINGLITDRPEVAISLRGGGDRKTHPPEIP